MQRLRIGRAGRALAVALLLQAAFAPVQDSRANEPDLTERQVVAAYVYNFTKFVRWPAGSRRDTLEVVVLDDEELHGLLVSGLESKRGGGHAFRVRKSTADVYTGYPDILFFGDSGADHVAGQLNRLRGRSVLTISRGRNFMEAGGTIQLIQVDGRITFDINYASTEVESLVVSSQMLGLARKVHFQNR